MADEKFIVTPEFRVAFSHVFETQKPLQEGGAEKYSVTMLFPKDADLSAMKNLAKQAVIEKWGPDKAKWPKGLRMPFRDQGEKEYEGFVDGATFCNATSKYKPTVVDGRNQEIIDKDQFYSGCWAKAQINAYAYDKAGNKGVAFGLQMIQKRRDDEPLGGRMDPSEVFAPVEGAGELDTENGDSDDLFD